MPLRDGRRTTRRRWIIVTAIAAAVAAVAALVTSALISGGAGNATPVGDASVPPPPTPSVSGPPSPQRPNIVFVLTDDLSTDLVRYMPHVRALERQGMSFPNYTVTDSLCCPSRSTIFTGRYPHDTHVLTNFPPHGGFQVFQNRGEEAQSFAYALHGAGYRTAMLGKYLNGYNPDGSVAGTKPPYVPQGWNLWAVAGDGYREYGYRMAINHQVREYGHAPADYLTDVLGGIGRSFIAQSAQARTPFFLEMATFAPHRPFIPAPRDAHSFAGLRAPRGPSFNRLPTDAPPWLGHRPKLSRSVLATLDHVFRQRVRSVQAVDRQVGVLEDTLRAEHQLSDTVFVFSSDNGFHLGQHGLSTGKKTAFDTDIRVPFVVTGPGIRAGSVDRSMVSNVDIAPTFDTLAGAAVPSYVDGRLMEPLLHGQAEPWRSLALVEHHGGQDGDDPDRQGYLEGNPPSYEAIRSATFLYVRYADGEREYYDLTTDPYENHNVYSSLSVARRTQLNEYVRALARCHGTAACDAAGQLTSG